MNAKELADVMEKYSTAGFMTPLASEFKEAATMLRKQQDRIGVLEANHNIQLDINEAALQYIEQLEQGLKASINLNRAQAERNQ